MINEIDFDNLIISFGFFGGDFTLYIGAEVMSKKVHISCQNVKSAEVIFYCLLRLVVLTGFSGMVRVHL